MCALLTLRTYKTARYNVPLEIVAQVVLCVRQNRISGLEKNNAMQSQENLKAKTEIEMTAKDIVELIQLLTQNEIEVYVDGGWGIDALIVEHTRKHGDLDIALPHEYAPKACDNYVAALLAEDWLLRQCTSP